MMLPALLDSFDPKSRPPADDPRWAQVLARSAAADGRFVYAVKSTGVFCRPTCPSRRPRRDQVSFCPTAAEAERAGFRACLRCKPIGARPVTDGPCAGAKAASYLSSHVSLLRSRFTSQPFETLEPARHSVPTHGSLVHHTFLPGSKTGE